MIVKSQNILKVFLLLGIVSLYSCIEFKEPFEKMPPGHWRGQLYLDQQSTFRPGIGHADVDLSEMAEKIEDNILPFLFEVGYDEDGELFAIFKNAEEEVLVTDISFGTDLSIAKDTFTMRFPGTDNFIKAIYAENIMQGFWSVPSRGNYIIPFEAFYSKKNRFELPLAARSEPQIDIDGKWRVTFNPGEENERTSIGEFRQDGTKITGTFINDAGDYRYLEGVVEDDKIWLSSFDGVFAFLFGAKKSKEGKLEGFFRSGRHFETSWTAVRDDKVSLNDPRTMTVLTDDFFRFNAKKSDGTEVTETDFLGQPTLLYITGSWCANCKDASNLLAELKEEYGVQVLGIAFERHSDVNAALRMVEKYRSDLKLDFPILLGGNLDREVIAASLPSIEGVRAYPTTFFLDSDFRIIDTYTGFSGPATSVYDEVVEIFHSITSQLVGYEQ